MSADFDLEIVKKVEPGDVVLLKARTPYPDHEQVHSAMEAICRHLAIRGVTGAFVMAVGPDWSVEKLDAEKLRELGLARIQ